MAKKKIQDPYRMELLDLLNEVGGTMKIEFGDVTVTVGKEQLQMFRDNGLKTDVMTCLIIGFMTDGKTKKDSIALIEESIKNGAQLSVSIEAAEGESLNISSPEENPMVDALVTAISEQGKED